MLVWDHTSCSVGHPLLDRQHQKLLQLAQEAEEALADISDAGQKKFHLILHGLSAYVSEHFRTEEALLEACGYPKLAEQKAEHALYEEKLTDFLVSATFGEFRRDELRQYIAAWWEHHILVEDMQYRDYVKQLVQPGQS